jgi:division protein CdvB (Snf7/Vps24/ESCRT-III family)
VAKVFDLTALIATFATQITLTMDEQTFDPKDTNKDGKVSVKEHLMHAADKAGEALDEAGDALKEGFNDVVDKVKAYKAMSPEEKKAKQEEWNGKITAAAEKASDSVKEMVDDLKDEAGKLFKKDKEA